MNERRKLAWGLLALLGLVLGYLLFWPVPIDPVAWIPPAAPAGAGLYEPNQRLAGVERLGVGIAQGPEDVAVDAEGRLYGGMEDGRILRFQPDGSQPELFVQTGGRPLGLDFDAQRNLIVADADRGLLSVSPDGSIAVLTTEHRGRPFRLTDDVEVGADGIIYFSDASSKFSVAEALLDVLEHGANGRLLAYDPSTHETRQLLEGLSFANGVAVSPDQAFVLVAETTKYRVQRYWLAGPHQGHAELFIENLPGFPDGVSSNGRGTFWLAVFAPRNPLLDFLLARPFLRKMLVRLPWLVPEPKHHGMVLGLDRDGRVVHNLQDASPAAYAPITSVEEHNGMLYLGSLSEKAIGRLPAP